MVKNDKIHGILIFLISEFLTLGKFQCILFLNSLFDDGLFVNFYIDI
jgi:hypothetical protein